MTKALTTTKDQPRHVALAEHLQARQKDFQAVTTIDVERAMRMVKNALLRDPKIADATTQSVYLEVQKAMADGLVLDGREAALVRYTNRSSGETSVTYIPMVAGIMKRVRRSGEINAWACELVYAQEVEQGRFRYVAAPDPELHHEPIIVGERGPVVAAYSAVRLKDGSRHYEVMTRDQLDAIRKRSRAQKGPWETDTDEMYRKTVIRRHAKRLPIDAPDLDVTQRIDGLYDGDIDAIEPEDAPAPVAKARAKSAKQRMAEVAEAVEADQTPPHDPDTGEVIEDDPPAEVLSGEVLDDDASDPF